MSGYPPLLGCISSVMHQTVSNEYHVVDSPLSQPSVHNSHSGPCRSCQLWVIDGHVSNLPVEVMNGQSPFQQSHRQPGVPHPSSTTHQHHIL